MFSPLCGLFNQVLGTKQIIFSAKIIQSLITVEKTAGLDVYL